MSSRWSPRSYGEQHPEPMRNPPLARRRHFDSAHAAFAAFRPTKMIPVILGSKKWRRYNEIDCRSAAIRSQESLADTACARPAGSIRDPSRTARHCAAATCNPRSSLRETLLRPVIHRTAGSSSSDSDLPMSPSNAEPTRRRPEGPASDPRCCKSSRRRRQPEGREEEQRNRLRSRSP